MTRRCCKRMLEGCVKSLLGDLPVLQISWRLGSGSGGDAQVMLLGEGPLYHKKG